MTGPLQGSSAGRIGAAWRALCENRTFFLTKFLFGGFYRLARSGFRIGRHLPAGLYDYTPDSTVYFNRMYLMVLLHRLGIRPITTITASVMCSGEGAGYQILLRLQAIAFARSVGLTYVHTPLFRVDHADKPMPEYAAEWERLFNLGHGEIVSDRVDLDILDFSWAPNSMMLKLFDHAESYSDIERAIPEFRRKFLAANARKPGSGDELEVAVHIRRGDIDPSLDIMWTDNDRIRTTIRSIEDALKGDSRAYRLSIVSEGEPEDFREFTQGRNDVDLYLNGNPVEAIRRLIQADILVLAKSSFSHVAGIVSEGIKIYEPSQYAPMSDWIVLDEASSFDARILQQRLRDHRPER